ncbi:hypothetical protein F5Y19DRAFT_476074 [Xylariaceae sp. FL1651]|nr:hypothetical protein F5Y19DRAFT_476074 [Xylariaceae sp. FL1651]
MSIVMKALGGGGVGDIAGTVVDLAEAGVQLSKLARQEAEALKEQARNDDNEFNIRKQFLDNAVQAIRDATYDQYNIVICTDQAHDDFQNLTGQILPMDLIDVEVRKDVIVNFQVYVFETGKYLRHGKWERDYWNWWGESKKWTDPAAMHVHFEKAQPKKDPNEIKALMDKKAADEKAAADAAAAAQKTQQEAAAAQAAEIKTEADHKAEEEAKAAREAGTATGESDDEDVAANESQDDNEDGNDEEEDQEEEDDEDDDGDDEDQEEEEEDQGDDDDEETESLKNAEDDDENEGEDEDGDEEDEDDDVN